MTTTAMLSCSIDKKLTQFSDGEKKTGCHGGIFIVGAHFDFSRELPRIISREISGGMFQISGAVFSTDQQPYDDVDSSIYCKITQFSCGKKKNDIR